MSKQISNGLYTRIIDALALELWRCNKGSSRANNLKGLRSETRALYRKMARRALNSSRDGFMEAKCVKCGCTDSRACEDGCTWVVVNRLLGQGVCSTCA
jgi:hypothetical protein